MQNTQTLNLKSKRGFSLIEIMIVLIIIGGLMAVIIPKVQDGREQSNVKNTKMRLSEISTKVNEYYAECGKYPTSITFLTDDDASCKNWTGNPKLKSLLKDAWNGDIEYSISGQGYNLKSQGKDKKEGGSSFDKDIYSDESVSGEE